MSMEKTTWRHQKRSCDDVDSPIAVVVERPKKVLRRVSQSSDDVVAAADTEDETYESQISASLSSEHARNVSPCSSVLVGGLASKETQEEVTPYVTISPESSVISLTTLLDEDRTDITHPQTISVKKMTVNRPEDHVTPAADYPVHTMLTPQKKKIRTLPGSIISVVLLLCAALLFRSQPPIDPDSVYVTGGGFSGYWFSIGRLKSIPDPASKTYYCYSAGCLAVVAAVSNCTMDQVLGMALNSQDKWKRGEISQYAVVTDFVDHLVATPNVHQLLQNDNLLSRIKVITATPKGRFGLASAVRSPTNAKDLHQLMIQTSWIPLVLGKRLWHDGNDEQDYHMDGAFSYWDHPVCAHRVGLPWRLDMFVNALNVNLGADLVERFWNAGQQYGL